MERSQELRPLLGQPERSVPRQDCYLLRLHTPVLLERHNEGEFELERRHMWDHSKALTPSPLAAASVEMLQVELHTRLSARVG